MNAVVLLRAVPDPEAPFDATDASWRLDPSSLVALGHALVWRKASPGARLIGLAAGPSSWEPALREALALGVDEARRVWSDAFAAANDVVSTAAALAAAVPDDAEAVFAGPPASDHGSGALAGALAQHLRRPLLSEVTSVEVSGGALVARVREKASRRRRYRVDAPAVLVAAQLPPPPLYPPLVRRLQARNAVIEETTPTVHADNGAPRLEVLSYGPARPRTRHLLQPASSGNAADRLRSLMGGGMTSRAAASSTMKAEDSDVTKQLIDLLEKEGILS